MVLSTKDYADFKAVVATMSDIDGIFFNPLVSLPGGLAGFVAIAYSSQPECAVNLYVDSGASPPSSGTFMTDFPSAIQLNQYAKASDHSEYSL